MRWDKELDIIVNKLSIKYSVDVNVVKDVVTSFFMIFKKVIQHPSMPSILVHNFGRFSPNKNRLLAKKYDCEAKLSEDLSDEEREKYLGMLENINNVLDRIESEKTQRNEKN